MKAHELLVQALREAGVGEPRLRPGSIEVESRELASAEEAWRALDELGFARGWVETTDALLPWPPEPAARAYAPLEAELVAGERSLWLRHQGGRWFLWLLRERADGPGLLLEERYRLRQPFGKLAVYTVHWAPDERDLLVPTAHRLSALED